MMKGQSFLVVALLASLALAGCTDEPATVDSTEDVMDGSEVQAAENVTLTFGPHSGLESERPADWAPTFDESPEWVLGEWWRIEITDGFTGETREVTRIAAGKEGQDYLVGMPIEEFDDEVMVLHFPCFGLVRASSLGCEAHDYMFEPLSFPLNVGDTWTSLWQGAGNTIVHEVEEINEDDMTALIRMDGPSGSTPSYVTYDANLGVISEFNVPSYESYRVIDHGFDYEGVVRVPYSHDMTIYHGRYAGAATMQQSSGILQMLGHCPPNVLGGCGDVNAPLETFTIPEVGQSGVVYDRASFALIAFDLGALGMGLASSNTGGTAPSSVPAGSGVASIKATAPDGTVYEMQVLATDGGGHVIDGYGHDFPAGDWDLQVIAGGAYAVFIEGITYTTFDVSLPSGCVIMEQDIHDHGGECGGHVHGIE